jgi:hypothetical protein
MSNNRVLLLALYPRSSKTFRFQYAVLGAKCTLQSAAPPDAAAPGVGFFLRLPNKLRA